MPEFASNRALRSEFRSDGLTLQLLRFGSRGQTLVYLPTSGGDFGEWQRYGFDSEIRPWVDAGRVQLYSIDACGPQSLFADGLSAAERIVAYRAAESALRRWLRGLADGTPTAPVDLLGASYGAFVAMNLLCREPDRVAHVTAFGGVFEMWHRLGGQRDPRFLPHTPLDYLAQWSEGPQLEAVRRTEGVRLFGARGDEWFPETPAIARQLARLRIPFALDVWDRPHRHHESTWREQLRKHLRQRYGSLSRP